MNRSTVAHGSGAECENELCCGTRGLSGRGGEIWGSDREGVVASSTARIQSCELSCYQLTFKDIARKQRIIHFICTLLAFGDIVL